jgi:hypothetical protein
MKRVPITDPIEARVAIIGGHIILPTDIPHYLRDVREASEVFAKTLETIYKRTKHDKGRAIASFDLIQQTKNVASDALILAHAEKEEQE